MTLELVKLLFGSQLVRMKARNNLRRHGVPERSLTQLNRKGEYKSGFKGESFELLASKVGSNAKVLEMSTPLGSCPSCLKQLRMLFSFDEIYLGDLFRADQQGQPEQKFKQDAKDAGNVVVDAGAAAADKASDASLVAAGGGVLAAPFTGGSSLTLTGYALSASTVSDVASTGFKTIDAMAFDGSYETVATHLLQTTISAGAGKLVNRAAARYAKFSETGGRFMIRATQATRSVPVSNKFGYTVMSARDATNVILDLQIKFSNKKE